MRKLCATYFVTLVLSGCASVGTNYDQNAVYRLQPGDDIRSVITALGQPNAETVDEKGNTILVWVHSTASVLGAEAHSVRLTFDPHGRLVAVPSRSATARSYPSWDEATGSTPLTVPPFARFSAGATARLQGNASDVLAKARAVLESDGFRLSGDVGPTSFTTAPMSFALKPDHADCGRSFGIPYVMDHRAKSTITYRVSALNGELKVQVAINSIFQAGYGAPNKTLTCTSTGALEGELLARLTR